MGRDATRPFTAEPMQFTRIHVPGEEALDLAMIVTG